MLWQWSLLEACAESFHDYLELGLQWAFPQWKDRFQVGGPDNQAYWYSRYLISSTVPVLFDAMTWSISHRLEATMLGVVPFALVGGGVGGGGGGGSSAGSTMLPFLALQLITTFCSAELLRAVKRYALDPILRNFGCEKRWPGYRTSDRSLRLLGMGDEAMYDVE